MGPMTTLTASVLEQHTVPRASGEPRAEPSAEPAVVPDFLLLGPQASEFVLPLADAALGGAAAPLRAVAWTARPLPAAAGDEEGRTLGECAARLGVPLVSSIAGACEPLFREAAAAPGRLVAVCDIGEESLGAFACLVRRVSPIEATAALCGSPLRGAAPGAFRVTLHGGPPPGVRGVDVALELARRWGRRYRDLGVECSGRGVASLEVQDRAALAQLLVATGAAHVLMPSDAGTREVLRAWGRDSDWREFRAGDDGGRALDAELDLGTLEPLVAPWTDPGFARPLRQAAGRPLRGIVLGPLADEADAFIWAAILAGRRIADGLVVTLIPGTAAARAALETHGAIERLRAAGVTVPDPAPRWEPPRPLPPGTWLACGAGPSLRAELGDVVWAANAEVCAVSALEGAIADPRQSEAVTPPFIVSRAAGARALPAAIADASVSRPAPLPHAAGPGVGATGALRAVVWAAVGDDFGAGHVLPRGARAVRLHRDGVADGLLAARPASADGEAMGRGVVVAGRNFGRGERADEAAWALYRAGVRAVLARSFAPEAVTALAYAGILPLASSRRGVGELARLGEEIEIPGVPEGVEPGHAVGVRNLTRGAQDALTHGLDEALVAIWRAGGRLAFGRTA